MSGAKIATVSVDSPASRAGVAIGDELVSVNGRAPTDVIEYQQLVDDELVEVVVRRAGSTQADPVPLTIT
ncbi:MAG TPA: PDZ domain-containing protein, partial [Acidimicrobiales bacterium]|nr:PDZ domain-containing protein [Acidimicrobiales bacterium]